MKKLIKFISCVFIVITVVILVHFVLTLNAVDSWLSSKFGEKDTDTENLLYTDRIGKYYLADEDHPCMYASQDRLYLVIGEKTADVTPDGINISYYGDFTDFNEIISHKENCIISDDGRYIVYRLAFNDIPYLYYYDTALEKAFYISDRVDSFDIMDNDGSDALTVIYATGYSQSNYLYMYVSDASGETAGTVELISQNNKVSGIFESYECVVYLSNDGDLIRYVVSEKEEQHLTDGVDKIYFPGKEKYNYDLYYKDFTVCAVKNGKDVILNASAEAEIEGGYYGVIPKFTFEDAEGNIYYYSTQNKHIIRVTGGEETVLYDEIGEIYHIFMYFDGGYFVAANKDTLYLLKDSGSEARQMMELPLRYCKRTQMLEEHMQVSMISEDVFYVNLLTSGSLVMNVKNDRSWLNRLSSYNYGLAAVTADGNSFECEMLNVPTSRYISSPVPVALNEKEGLQSYISYFSDGTVKAVSVLSVDGKIQNSDILGTASYAEGQCSIEVFTCSSGTYILKQQRSFAAEFYVMDDTASSLDVVTDNNGIFTENYEDFNCAVSFGKLVIF